MARAVASHLAPAPGAGGATPAVRFDSCGTGPWHAGHGADPRAVAVCARRGVRLEHVARQIDPALDFSRFDLLLPMDWDNHAKLLRLGAPASRVRMLRSFDPALATITAAGDERLVVPDPYQGTDADFDAVYDMLVPACRGLLGALASRGTGAWA